ncbi:hypothetical protein HMPREF0373_02870 [Eubacterium ramulus ATCC 29099]|uniref:Uncharacterized protein n=1 Tax=Eubacterium ramulus ATCC 29099 TaxID=1256908 RepID=U2PFH8_EUBRA|nr:hypothetical protein HMPREF0373_02870 [Eubacterium ramulus ATCC 29099]
MASFYPNIFFIILAMHKKSNLHLSVQTAFFCSYLPFNPAIHKRTLD